MNEFFAEREIDRFVDDLSSYSINVDDLLSMSDRSIILFTLNNKKILFENHHLPRLSYFLRSIDREKLRKDFHAYFLKNIKDFSFENLLLILPLLFLSNEEEKKFCELFGYQKIFNELKGAIEKIFSESDFFLEKINFLIRLIDSQEITYSLSTIIYERLIFSMRNDIVEYNFVGSIYIYTKIMQRVNKKTNIALLSFIVKRMCSIAPFLLFDDKDIGILINSVHKIIDAHDEPVIFYNFYKEIIEFLLALRSKGMVREEKVAASFNMNLLYILYERAFSLGNRLFLPEEIDVLKKYSPINNRFFTHKYLLLNAFSLDLEPYLRMDFQSQEIFQITDFSVMQKINFSNLNFKVENHEIIYFCEFYIHSPESIQLRYIEYINEIGRTDLLFLFSYHYIKNENTSPSVITRLLFLFNGDFYDFNNIYRKKILLKYVTEKKIELDFYGEQNLMNLPLYFISRNYTYGEEKFIDRVDSIAIAVRYFRGQNEFVALLQSIYYDSMKLKDYKLICDIIFAEDREMEKEAVETLYRKTKQFEEIDLQIRRFS